MYQDQEMIDIDELFDQLKVMRLHLYIVEQDNERLLHLFMF
jgi:hypothetical protein